MKTFFLLFGLITGSVSSAQTAESVLANAMKTLEKDAQFKHAIISLLVIDSKTGKVVFDKNSQLGLAPASCLKVVTSAATLELLGKDYRYKTEIAHDGIIRNDSLIGNLHILSFGDPTLGSFRWESTATGLVLKNILAVLAQKKIKVIAGNLIINESNWDTQATPRGWTWEDIGNYYGAGAKAFNWHENQYDVLLKPGKKIGDAVELTGTEPPLQVSYFVNELKTGAVGSGDNSVIYLPEDGTVGFIRGTVPAGKENFKVSGAMPDASLSFINSFELALKANHINMTGKGMSYKSFSCNNMQIPQPLNTLLKIDSPPLDSINYWFLQKSVNLYGEAFIKTIALEKSGFAATESGIDNVKDFWSKRGIEKSALNIKDGSGLSPANRLTTDALVTVMQYAKKQNWFSSFYNALPLQNGIKMKSGYIGGARSYTGYINSKSGTEYTFAFIINNYDGSPGVVREKMWRLLDILK